MTSTHDMSIIQHGMVAITITGKFIWAAGTVGSSDHSTLILWRPAICTDCGLVSHGPSWPVRKHPNPVWDVWQLGNFLPCLILQAVFAILWSCPWTRREAR